MSYTLYTAGYARWTVPALQAELERMGALCVDVRIVPNSRRQEWSGAALRQTLGDAYHHIPDLGNPNAFNGGPLALLRPERGIPKLLNLLKRQPVIVLCQCADWRCCHRRLVVEAAQRANPATSVVHLEPPPMTLHSGELLAITVHQPWASLFVVEARFPGAGKRDETRDWTTRHRGWLAIHAAKGGLPKAELEALCARPAFRQALALIGIDHPAHLPRGYVVALAHIVDSVPTEDVYPAPAPHIPNWNFGDFSPGRFAWRSDRVLALPTPIFARGAQNLWRWTPPADVWGMIEQAQREAA